MRLSSPKWSRRLSKLETLSKHVFYLNFPFFPYSPDFPFKPLGVSLQFTRLEVFYFKYTNYFNGLDMEIERRAKEVRAMTRLAKRTGLRHGTP